VGPGGGGERDKVGPTCVVRNLCSDTLGFFQLVLVNTSFLAEEGNCSRTQHTAHSTEQYEYHFQY